MALLNKLEALKSSTSIPRQDLNMLTAAEGYKIEKARFHTHEVYGMSIIIDMVVDGEKKMAFLPKRFANQLEEADLEALCSGDVKIKCVGRKNNSPELILHCAAFSEAPGATHKGFATGEWNWGEVLADLVSMTASLRTYPSGTGTSVSTLTTRERFELGEALRRSDPDLTSLPVNEDRRRRLHDLQQAERRRLWSGRQLVHVTSSEVRRDDWGDRPLEDDW